MKKALKIIPTIISILSLIFLGFLALIYIPGPKSEPVVTFFEDEVNENTDGKMIKTPGDDNGNSNNKNKS